jgi:3-mercaptopyruvate sulfurtransferase SseA
MSRRAILAVVGIGVFALLFAGLAATRNRGVPKTTGPQTAIASQAAPALVSPRNTLESVPRVSATTLRGRIGRGEVLVIDVRDADSYVTSHIPGARQIPLVHIESEAPYLRGPQPIVTYCT